MFVLIHLAKENAAQAMKAIGDLFVLPKWSISQLWIKVAGFWNSLSLGEPGKMCHLHCSDRSVQIHYIYIRGSDGLASAKNNTEDNVEQARILMNLR